MYLKTTFQTAIIKNVNAILYFRLWKIYPTGTRLLSSQGESELVQNVSKLLNIPKENADYLCLKYPLLYKFGSNTIESVVIKVNELGLNKTELAQKPVLFTLNPLTLQLRYNILNECGIQNITCQHLASYLNIMKSKTIKDLKRSKYIHPSLNVENKLASYMCQWPTSLTTLIQGDSNGLTLFELRLKIIQRYLELVLDLTEDQFTRGIGTYPNIKHRPLQMISEILSILQSTIKMTPDKIKSNLYLIHANTDNLNKIIYKIRRIADIDVKELMRMYPKLCTTNYSNIIEIKNILQEYGINNEAQKRCINIYTLSSSTVRERLEMAKQTPEFSVYLSHPRFLKIILYNKNASKRVLDLYNKSGKKCVSLNALTGCSDHYKNFEKAPGDRSGKGKDLLYFLSQEFDNAYSISELKKKIVRHPYWINVPIVHTKLVFQKLALKFSHEDIYSNCPILLYPLNVINTTLNLLNGHRNSIAELSKCLPYADQIDFNNLDMSQKLSLTLYILERNHYFSGNGVWNNEKLKEQHLLENNKMANVN